MKRNILYIISLIIVFSCAKDIIDLTGSVEGFVKDEETNECLQGVSITLSPSGKTTTTGSDGRYSFMDLEASNYSIEFAKLGYETNKKEITILSGKRAPLDIMLKKISNALIITPEILDFGELETSKTFFVSSLEQFSDIKYTIKSDAQWISISKLEGNASSGGDKIIVVIDRSKLSIGNYEKNITISSIYGEKIIPVTVTQVERDIATLTTNAPENITETSLVIKGTIIKTGGLKITSYGHCWSETEQPTIDNNKNNLGDTKTIGDFTSTLTNLTAGKTYYIRSYAVNSKGVAYSEQVSVTIPIISKPTVVTRDISNLKRDSVCLNGVIVDKGNGNINELGFYWGLTEKTENKQIVRTVIDSTFSYILKSLQVDKTYYYKAYAINEKGKGFGEIKTFTSFNKDYVEGAPTVFTENATEIMIGRATLKGYILDFGDSEIIQIGFYYGESVSTMIKKSVSTKDSIFTLNITDLKDDTKYFYKAFAVNSRGESCGDIKEFKTKVAKAPEVQTLGATDINIESATLNGEIIDCGDYEVTQRGFYFGTNEENLIKKVVNTTQNIYNLIVSDLKDDTKYFYKAFAVSSRGESCGSTKTFTTLEGKMPVIVTNDATDVSFEQAILKGTIATLGDYEILECGFYYGIDKSSMTKVIGCKNGNIISVNTDNLSTNTVYYYKVYVATQKGEVYGNIVAFSTLDESVVLPWDGSIASSYAGGAGTKYDPYIIKTGGQLLYALKQGIGYLKLVRDIDLNNQNWRPYEFSGTLEGNGHCIYNLRIDRDDELYYGLVGSLNGTIKDLTISGVNIKTSNSKVGVIAGQFDGNGRIENCNVILTAGSILQGNSHVGGIVGYYTKNNANIENCIVEANDRNIAISGVNGVGGIVGSSIGSDINNCKVFCNIIGDENVGGILGGNFYSYGSSNYSINSCEYAGNLNGIKRLGGIVGFSYNKASIIGCKTTTNIEGEESSGGIIGWSDTRTCIIACYTSGSIGTLNKYQGHAMIGRGGSTVDDIYCSYTTMKVNGEFKKIYGIDCFTVYDSNNIKQDLLEAYSEYAEYWNFNNTWTWTGVIDGVTKNVVCPRLSWE